MTELEQFIKHVQDLAHTKGLRIAIVAENKKDVAVHICNDIDIISIEILGNEITSTFLRRVLKDAMNKIETDELLKDVFKN